MKKVLVCDDDQGVLGIIEIILKNNGYQVLCLEGGKAIIKKVKEYKPNIILLDLWMPGLDGKEVVKLLKEDPETKNIPLIIISALNDTQKISKEIYADGFISKPFDIYYLLEIVNKNIN